MPIDEIRASISLPFGLGNLGGTWRPDTAQREAAWEMYVELVTRVATVPLDADEGYLREALTSFYSLFPTTRAILRERGPSVAKRRRGDDTSFAELAVGILNLAVRPVLAQWHPRLEEYESRRPPDRSRIEWEREWDEAGRLRDEIEATRVALMEYAGILAEAADVVDLTSPQPLEDEP